MNTLLKHFCAKAHIKVSNSRRIFVPSFNCTHQVYYKQPPEHPSFFQVVIHPVLAVKYTLIYLGSSFCAGTPWDPSIVALPPGLILVAGYVFCAVYAAKHLRADAAFGRRILPWISLGAFVLLNDGLTSLGRLGYGISQARASRYLCFSTMLPIALMCLAPNIRNHYAENSQANPKRLRWIDFTLWTVAASLAVLNVLGFIESQDAWKNTHRDLLYSRALVSLVDAVEEPEQWHALVIDSTPARLKSICETLDGIHYLRPGLVKSHFVDAIANVEEKPSDIYGSLLIAKREGSNGLFAGIGLLPEKHRPADAIILSADDAQHRPVMFAVCAVTEPTPPFGDESHRAFDDHCGWFRRIPLNRLPASAGTLKAWAYDAETGRARRMADKRK